MGLHIDGQELQPASGAPGTAITRRRFMRATAAGGTGPGPGTGRSTSLARRPSAGGEADAIYGLFGIQANPGFQIFPYLWGGDLWPKDLYAQGIAQSSLWTTPPVPESIQFIQDLAHRHRVIPPQGAPTRPFNMGGSALWMTDARAGSNALKDVTFPWGLAPMPRQVTNKTVAFTNGMMTNKGAQVPEAAWQTIKYITGEEGQVDRIRPTSAPPTRTDAFDPWLDSVQPRTVHQSKALLKEVATGYLASYQDAWPHYVAEATNILPILSPRRLTRSRRWLQCS